MTLTEEIQNSPELLALVPDTKAIAEALSNQLVQRSITVDEVFDSLFQTGDYITIKQAKMAGNPVANFAFEILADAKNIGPGSVNFNLPATVALLDQLQAAELLSEAGRAALMDRAQKRREVSEFDVRKAIFNDDGSYKVVI